jgi:hypothetical protein
MNTRICTLSFIFVTYFSQAQTPLITPDEAKLPNAPILETRAITRGPAVKVETPGEVQAKSFTLKINFEPRGGASINPSSLRVVYLKQPNIDLTSRFKVGLQNDQIDLANVMVPTGEHPIMIKIKDSEGREGSHLVRLVAK